MVTTGDFLVFLLVSALARLIWQMFLLCCTSLQAGLSDQKHLASLSRVAMRVPAGSTSSSQSKFLCTSKCADSAEWDVRAQLIPSSPKCYPFYCMMDASLSWLRCLNAGQAWLNKNICFKNSTSDVLGASLVQRFYISCLHLVIVSFCPDHTVLAFATFRHAQFP